MKYMKEIICNELKVINGVKSIILIGSRARGEARIDSDYDLYVVMSSLFVPFTYSNLKRKEKILENVLGTHVSINPLTLSRILRGSDLLLLKTKKEGITLWGKNYLPLININNLCDVPSDEFFSYFFSCIFFLMKDFDLEKGIEKKSVFNVSKAITCCNELELMVKEYDDNKTDTIWENEEINNNIRRSITLSKLVLNGDFSVVRDPTKFWFSARKYLIFIFRQLMEKLLKDKTKNIESLIDVYKNSNPVIIKNIQYSFLFMLEKRKFPLSIFYGKKSIEKNIGCSLFYLMLSIGEVGAIKEEHLYQAHQTLKSVGLFNKISTNGKTLWRETKNIIVENWFMASAKSII